MNNIKQLSKADYEAIFDLSQFAFQYVLSPEEMKKKREEAERHIIWGWMEEETLAAKVHLIPLSCYILGKEFEMGGISAVATWPEYRRKGMVKHLLKHALQYMRKQGQTISYLHPFSIPFYRKFGWELAFAEKAYTIPMKLLRKQWNGVGYVRRENQPISLLHPVYTAYAKGFSGMLVRDLKWWEQRILKKDAQIAVAYNDKGEAEGYVMYDVKDKKLTVQDMASTSLNGRKLLLQFLANHDSMAENVEMVVSERDQLDLIVDEPIYEQKVQPYFMARIVDVAAFLKQYPFTTLEKSCHVSLIVEDEFLPENNGVYHIKVKSNESTVTYVKAVSEQTQGIHCSVQTLAAIMLGYKRPVDLYGMEKLKGSKEAIEKLEQIVPLQEAFFADYF
ncbi:GNAT family N-acetyltransferase [Virgibacillus sp. LDC-1]|uniref:GNAT family N-acetyltransferase n=1 Tax=Virgibacillus sp. LDC-1 TaxID=3039856 RepID=UPI0024DE5791|nr:GNAT family N-acetyltransferase [Virgibacillus sp. LDC-1]